jgi:hypothetical protein
MFVRKMEANQERSAPNWCGPLRTGQNKTQKSNHKAYGGAQGAIQGFVEKGEERTGGWTKGQRKEGVKREEKRSWLKKKYKNTLDRKMLFARYSRRASNCLPPVRTFRRSSPIRTAEKTSARSTGVGTID